ncbi:MAG TPA: glycosyltransferase WbuB [Phycisphaerales bacterium]|nr:glycosyltransferase WbuB [Phycisphaerales bacterium]
MRILMINQVFYPDVAATAQHGHDLARHLVEHGHEVTAISSRSLYGEKGAKLASKEIVDGIEIHRVGRSLFGKTSIIARALDFVLFYLAATWRALTLSKHDVVICFTTPPFITLTGLLLRVFKGSRVVCWVMDLYPDVPIVCGLMKPDSLPSRFFEWLSRLCLNSVDRNVVLGRCMQELIESKGVPSEKISLIGVWSDNTEVREVPRDRNEYRAQWGVGDRTLIMYSGNFGIGHDVDTFLNAALSLRDDDRIRFAFVGGGKRKSTVETFVHEHDLEETCILAPYQPRERLDELLSAADAHLVTLLSGREGVMVPCKLFGILAVSRPALYVGPAESEISRVIVENDCGASVLPGDSARLARTITGYADDPESCRQVGARARAALEASHTMHQRCVAWTELLENVVSGPR